MIILERYGGLPGGGFLKSLSTLTTWGKFEGIDQKDIKKDQVWNPPKDKRVVKS